MGIEASHLHQQFGTPPTPILFDISLKIEDGEFVAVTGRSGSGKSTLLYILSTLDRPSSGTLSIAGRDVTRMDSKELHRFRNLHMGFVFQFHHLLPELTALENVLLPARKTGKSAERGTYARELFREFGLEGKENRFPRQLSGGEQQRVAIARALIMEPSTLFADEPTGNLDSINGEIVMNLLEKVNREKKTTVVYVTHDLEFARRAKRVISIVDGRVASD